jgi:hypothetical protein
LTLKGKQKGKCHMDPQACYERLVKAIEAHNDSATVEAMTDLLVWAIGRGNLVKYENLEPLRLAGAYIADRLEDIENLESE